TVFRAWNRAGDRRGVRLGRLRVGLMRRPPRADAPATEELVAFGYSRPRKVSERDHSSKRKRPGTSKRARPTLRRGCLEDDVATTRRGRAPRLEEDVSTRARPALRRGRLEDDVTT